MSDKRAFVTLDGLRGIAALAIVTRHAPAFFASVAVNVLRSDGGVTPVGPFIESYLAVDFFFALSGFVLAHAYGDRLRNGMAPSRFMTVRLIRLYPLYFVALLLSLVVAQRQWAYGTLSIPFLVGDVLFALLLLPSPASSVLLFPLNSPAWSLFNELLANAVFGLMGKWLKTPLLLLIVSISGIVLLCSVSFGWLGFGTEQAGAMVDGYKWQSLGAGIARVAYSFFAGVLVFQVWAARRPKITLPPLALAAALVAVLMARPAHQFQAAFDLMATLVVFPCLIFLGASTGPTGLLARLFTWVGVASYAVYVLQVPLYEFSVIAGRKFASIAGGTMPQPSWTSGVAFIAFLLGVALFCDKYIDRPLRAAASEILLKPADAKGGGGSRRDP